MSFYFTYLNIKESRHNLVEGAGAESIGVASSKENKNTAEQFASVATQRHSVLHPKKKKAVLQSERAWEGNEESFTSNG